MERPFYGARLKRDEQGSYGKGGCGILNVPVWWVKLLASVPIEAIRHLSSPSRSANAWTQTMSLL